MEQFAPLFCMTDSMLANRCAVRVTADTKPGYPCRVSLVDAEAGEELILIPFKHHDVTSAYQASGPVFVRKGALQAKPAVNEVPDSIRGRLLSIRGYDTAGNLIDSDVSEGCNLEHAITRFFSDPRVLYLHLHNARPGCYSCRVDRASGYSVAIDDLDERARTHHG